MECLPSSSSSTMHSKSHHHHHNRSYSHTPKGSTAASTPTIPSLLDLTSIIVSQTYPFQYIEDRYKNIIPEPVQKSIIYHSFPKHESQVLVYASSDFNPDRYGVDQVVQIGFHVSGIVYETQHSSSTASSSSRNTRKISRRTSTSNNNNTSNNNDDDYHHQNHHEHGAAGSSDNTASTSSVLPHHQNHHAPHYSSNSPSFKVSLTFDRGKITSVSCNCENENSLIFWCDHVIALALHRIRKCTIGVDFVLRVPISEALLQLNRSQLQKLVQYLISDHTDVLPTAQRLVDEILFMKTDDNFINRIHGAPDPTAGPSPQEPHSWALNESQIQSQVRQFISSSSSSQSTSLSSTSSSTSSPSSASLLLPSTGSSQSSSSSSSSSPSNVIQTLIEKIYKMIQSRDSNAERILQIITTELVRHCSSKSSPYHNTRSSSSSPSTSSSSSTQISNSIWDQIIRIWNVIVLKPGITDSESQALTTILTTLAKNESLPESEEINILPSNSDNDDEFDSMDASPPQSQSHSSSSKRQKLHPTTPSSPRQPYESIFKTPLSLLKQSTNIHDYHILSLHSRVCHGYHDTPYALQILDNLRSSSSKNSTTTSTPQPLLLRLENAHLLFNVLKPTHPKEAYETALIGLTTPTILKSSAFIQEKHLKLVEKLIAKILTLPHQYTDILTNYVEKLLEHSATSFTKPSSHHVPPTFPLITFASYVFNALSGNDLAYKLALTHLNISPTTEQNPHSHSHHSFIHSHLESQQITLATSLLTSAKDNPTRLEEISSTLIRVVKSNTNLFRLAQEVFKHSSTLSTSNTNENLTTVAFNMALHVIKSTKYNVHRRRWEMVRWVVSCGVEIGVTKLFYLVRNWGEYFTAVEAVGSVASNILAWVGSALGGSGGAGSSSSGGNSTCVNTVSGIINSVIGGGPPPSIAAQQACNERGCGGSGSGNGKLGNVDVRILEELGSAARNLAIQCARNDPQNCCLNTLTLCETDPIAFETSYQIVLESAAKEFLTPQQIFTIARYMEHRGYTQRAYRLAVIAVQHVHIGYNQDTHSLISEIHWTCNLSHQLSTPIIPSSSSQPRASSSSSSFNPLIQQQPKSSIGPIPYNYRILPQQQQQSSSQQAPGVVGGGQQQQQPSSLLLQGPATEWESLIPLLIRNIKCATVLTEILRRSVTIMSSYENAYQKGGSGGAGSGSTNSGGVDTSNSGSTTSRSSGGSSSSSSSSSKKILLKQRVYEKLSLLVEGTIDSYITTIHSRLVHISPRHYSDFIEFLGKARENFMLAPGGEERFKCLVESMKGSYKGKKKLLFLLAERFG